MRRILSVDPGDRCGWALWEDGVLDDHGIVNADEMLDMLHRWPFPKVDVVVVEDFVLDYRARKQRGSRMVASQVIGALGLFVRQHHAVLIKQRTESRDMGYVHSGIKKAGTHRESHDLDAIAHGVWWWEASGIVPDVSLLDVAAR